MKMKRVLSIADWFDLSPQLNGCIIIRWLFPSRKSSLNSRGWGQRAMLNGVVWALENTSSRLESREGREVVVLLLAHSFAWNMGVCFSIIIYPVARTDLFLPGGICVLTWWRRSFWQRGFGVGTPSRDQLNDQDEILSFKIKKIWQTWLFFIFKLQHWMIISSAERQYNADMIKNTKRSHFTKRGIASWFFQSPEGNRWLK